jgi:hypothetical protein
MSFLSSLLRFLGIGKETYPKVMPVKRLSFEDRFEIVKAVFDKDELGPPLDWASLGAADEALLSAFVDRNAVRAREALAAGANADLNCGFGCTTTMLAAATGDAELVAAFRKAGARETPDAQPYLEILNFPADAQRPAFKTALAEIERLSGTKPAAGDRRGLYTFELDATAAKSFLESHQTRFFESGCFIFLYDQHFGYGGRPDELWVLPTRDKFAVMAFTGVAAPNYEIDNYIVIRWLKKLDRDHPFLLTGCGEDFLSGQFAAPISDPDDLAEKMYVFCPDIVDQGTGTVEALAAELRKTNQLYFWWD